jgi:DNA-binding MarR family transcriptional regulator
VLLQNLSRRADEHLERFGLTTRQWLLLAVLDKRFGQAAPTLSEAATAYGSSRQNVKQIALQLVDRGYLRLEPDAVDRRVTRLWLTGKHRVFDEPAVAAEQAAFLADIFAALDSGDLSVLRGLVVRCLHQLGGGAQGSPVT